MAVSSATEPSFAGTMELSCVTRLNPAEKRNGHAIRPTTNNHKHKEMTNGVSKSAESKSKKRGVETFEAPTFLTIVLTNLGFLFLMGLGYISCLLFTPKVAKEKHRNGYPPLYDAFDLLYMRYVYRRLRDCYNQPICSVPGAEVTLVDRVTRDYCWTFEYTGTKTQCLNLGSYNYLGFAEATGVCADLARDSIQKYGTSFCSPVYELGGNEMQEELELLTAQFLGVESAIVFGMGFATNTLNIPSLLGPDTLVLSDARNHASLIVGLRLSGAKVIRFEHNNMKSLESKLRSALLKGKGQWKRVIIVVEGIYSMEGTIAPLPELIAIKKKYKTYLYLDEAHSVGALGPHGRGVVDYHGCDPTDVDIMMGTFTKSFGSAGGYIAGSKRLIDYLRQHSQGTHYAVSMAPAVAAQILGSMRVMMRPEGERRVRQLARNTRYFRDRLRQMGFIVIGNEHSPVVPLMVYLFSKIGAVVRSLRERGIAAVGVGYPATPVNEGRIRFCLSASHTKQQLDFALDTLDSLADELGLRYSRRPRSTQPVIYGAEEPIEH